MPNQIHPVARSKANIPDFYCTCICSLSPLKETRQVSPPWFRFHFPTTPIVFSNGAFFSAVLISHCVIRIIVKLVEGDIVVAIVASILVLGMIPLFATTAQARVQA
mmetsp:Transcript_20206/g.43660  ORF Transcript_20206/g.43660 Transcript_20206/m.43660 type:complete len:106 (-) Transcript_20206:496-813(-)